MQACLHETYMYLNKVILMGNLTRDPEVKALPSGVKVVSFSLATNRTWKDQSGKKQDQTEYHNVVAYARPAEVIAQYSKKGSSLYVEGRLQTRSWDDQTSGQKKYRTEIVLETFQFGPKLGGATTGDTQTRTWRKEPSSSGSANSTPEEDTLDTIEYPEEDINAEDIPF